MQSFCLAIAPLLVAQLYTYDGKPCDDCFVYVLPTNPISAPKIDIDIQKRLLRERIDAPEPTFAKPKVRRRFLGTVGKANIIGDGVQNLIQTAWFIVTIIRRR